MKTEVNPMEHAALWQCECGAVANAAHGDWRFNGKDWEHSHGYPVGHVVASKLETTTDPERLIRDLLKGIQGWSADEDGVHPECWDAYKRAKAYIGEFNWKSCT